MHLSTKFTYKIVCAKYKQDSNISEKTLVISWLSILIKKYKFLFRIVKLYRFYINFKLTKRSTVTSCLFTHIVSTEKMIWETVKIWEVTNILIVLAVFWCRFLLKADWGLSHF